MNRACSVGVFCDSFCDSLFFLYSGTTFYCPPEWILYQKYFGVSATVWGLGILLYDLLVGDMPFDNYNEITEAQVPPIPGLSHGKKTATFFNLWHFAFLKFHLNSMLILCLITVHTDCKDLIMRCLNQDPDMRPSFDEILSHKWFNK